MFLDFHHKELKLIFLLLSLLSNGNSTQRAIHKQEYEEKRVFIETVFRLNSLKANKLLRHKRQEE
jgi:hypothetical protein